MNKNKQYKVGSMFYASNKWWKPGVIMVYNNCNDYIWIEPLRGKVKKDIDASEMVIYEYSSSLKVYPETFYEVK